MVITPDNLEIWLNILFYFRDDIFCAADKTKEDIRQVTILVNNANTVSGTSVLDTPDSRIVKAFEVNVLALGQ